VGWNGHHAKVASASTIGVGAVHLVDLVPGRINGARKAIAARLITNDLDTPCGHLIAEWCFWFKVDGIPCELDESVALRIGVTTSNIGTPVSPWIVF